MKEKDFDKGYKSGFKFGKEVANEEWVNRINQAAEQIDNVYEDLDGYDPQSLCMLKCKFDEVLNQLIESEVNNG